MQTKDDWHKPRSHGQHLTTEEIAFIRESYASGRRLADVARALQCSSRIVSKYYGYFREEGIARPKRAPVTLAVRRGEV